MTASLQAAPGAVARPGDDATAMLAASLLGQCEASCVPTWDGWSFVNQQARLILEWEARRRVEGRGRVTITAPTLNYAREESAARAFAEAIVADGAPIFQRLEVSRIVRDKSTRGYRSIWRCAIAPAVFDAGRGGVGLDVRPGPGISGPDCATPALAILGASLAYLVQARREQLSGAPPEDDQAGGDYR